jgi:hypothetical protein
MNFRCRPEPTFVNATSTARTLSTKGHRLAILIGSFDDDRDALDRDAISAANRDTHEVRIGRPGWRCALSRRQVDLSSCRQCRPMGHRVLEYGNVLLSYALRFLSVSLCLLDVLRLNSSRCRAAHHWATMLKRCSNSVACTPRLTDFYYLYMLFDHVHK